LRSTLVERGEGGKPLKEKPKVDQSAVYFLWSVGAKAVAKKLESRPAKKAQGWREETFTFKALASKEVGPSGLGKRENRRWLTKDTYSSPASIRTQGGREPYQMLSAEGGGGCYGKGNRQASDWEAYRRFRKGGHSKEERNSIVGGTKETGNKLNRARKKSR